MGIGVKNGVETPHAPQKMPRWTWENSLQIYGEGTKSRKRPTLSVGNKSNGKSQFMKKLLVRFGTLAVALLVIAGCSTPLARKMNRLDLGMTGPQVKKILGDDFIVKAAKTTTNGSTLQLWEYTDKKTQATFQLYFKDSQLAQWGSRGQLEFPELTLPNR
jgi:hypothetical protein